MNIDFKTKYLKYKNKYLELSGGAFPFPFGTSTKFTIMAKLGSDTLDRVNERRTGLKLPHST